MKDAPVLLTYTGSSRAVTIATGESVARGESVEVAGPLASDLISQGWQIATPVKPAAKRSGAPKGTTTTPKEG